MLILNTLIIATNPKGHPTLNIRVVINVYTDPNLPMKPVKAVIKETLIIIDNF